MLVSVREDATVDPDARPCEVVERKGIGHPDSLADSLADSLSRDYSQYCLAEFGRVANHWFDKVTVIGAESEVTFGAGTILQPMVVRVVGKVTRAVGTRKIPVVDLALGAARRVLGEILPLLDLDRDLRIELDLNDNVGAGRSASRYRPASVEDLPILGDVGAFSNDSVITTAYAPLSRLERLVLDLELWLTAPETKEGLPWTGNDVKVVGMRLDDVVELVLRVPFIASLVPDEEAYWRAKDTLAAAVTDFVAKTSDLNVALFLNSDDAIGNRYLTVTGTVADTGDIGVVGRGNRSNGLINPGRPMSIEAPAGKNPLDHTGKLYAELATRIAHAAADATGSHAQVTLATGRGRPLVDPHLALVETATFGSTSAEALQAIAELYVHDVRSLAGAFLRGEWISGSHSA